MANILILGGGFGGLIAAERLAGSLDSNHRITLVSPSRKFTFYPALVNLVFDYTGVLDITFDLAAKLSGLGVRYVQGEMIGIDEKRQKVEVAGADFSGEIGYDYLVIAMGRRLATEKVPGFFEYAHHLLGVSAAERFREAIREFDSGTIIVGACPDSRLPVPVCETAFALARMFDSQLQDGTIILKLIFPGSLEDAFGGANLHKELEAAFQRHKISLLYDVPVSEITEHKVLSTAGHQIKYDLLMLVPPFRGHAMFRDLGITDDSNYVKVDERMRVFGKERMYAAGDIVAFTGPKFAHMAIRQAEVASANLISEINGDVPDEVYNHEIATIIDAGGADSIYLHYGIWDDAGPRVKKGNFWGLAKDFHDAFWLKRHR
jgi:sulfide:quinone oxidoreductase